MRPLALALVLALAGCNFAVKHPAVTAGIVAGTVALATCELGATPSSPLEIYDTRIPYAKCFAISGGAGVGLALITALALWIGYEDDTVATPNAGGTVEDPSNLEPAPVFVPNNPKPEPPKPEPPKPEPPEPPEPEPPPGPTPEPARPP